MPDEINPITDEEFLYRRVPELMPWFDPATRTLKSFAFRPDKQRDVTGLSVTRAKFKSVEQAARGRPGKSYYVAVLRAGDLRNANIRVVPQPNLPDGFDISHAELPDLRADNYKSTETLERQRTLAEELCLQVEGPFETEQSTTA